jgi:type VI secretion system secreted protein VgrG
VTSLTHEGKQAQTTTTVGAHSRPSILSANTHQALLSARNTDNPAIRDLAEALLHIASRFQAGDQTANRALSQWLYHAGQVSKDLPSTAAAAGGNPLEALAIPNLLDDLARWTVVEYDAPVYHCRFECIPSSVTYRPPRVTPWPVMRGTQTARVVGPSGEEIYTDKYGRVKVQFNWDREGKFDEKSSCWIRVSQGMAGGQYGMLFLPRVGQEVIVDFLEGDPDKPIIVGRVYNADNMPPYTLPDEKTKSVIKTHSSKGGGGTNEIRFEDLKDSEQIFIHAQKDLHIRVTNDRVENVEANRNLQVGAKKFEKVEKDSHLEVKENKFVKIGIDHDMQIDGKESVKIGGTRSHDVGGDVVDKFGANHKHEVTQTYATKALSIKLEASTGIELKCGGSSIVLTPAAIFIMGGPLVNINSGAGPPVGPVMAMATGPQPPEAPGSADDSTPGQDVTYSGGGELVTAEPAEQVAGYEFQEEEVEEKETTWIDLELVDEEEQPVPGEKYIVIDSAGNEKKGTLDANGRAHVTGIVPGECEVFYPNLDAEAWERT